MPAGLPYFKSLLKTCYCSDHMQHFSSHLAHIAAYTCPFLPCAKGFALLNQSILKMLWFGCASLHSSVASLLPPLLWLLSFTWTSIVQGSIKRRGAWIALQCFKWVFPSKYLSYLFFFVFKRIQLLANSQATFCVLSDKFVETLSSLLLKPTF